MSDLVVHLSVREEVRDPAIDATLRAADSALRACIETSPVTVIIAGPPAKARGTVHESKDLPRLLDEWDARREEQTATPPALHAAGAPALGLEPVRMRKRRDMADPPPTMDAEASEVTAETSSLDEPMPSVDRATPALRQTVIENEEPPARRFPPRVTWPLVVGVSLCAWYGLIELVMIAWDLSLDL
jgi:hypothetical protein